MTYEENSIAKLLVSGRYLLLLCAAALIIAGLFYTAPLKFDRSIESMFRADDELLIDFLNLKRIFEGNDILMVAYPDDDLLNPDRKGIVRLDKIGTGIRQVDGVQDVVSLAEINRMLMGDFGSQRNSTAEQFSSIADPEHLLGQRFIKLFAGYTHSSDGKIAAAICILEPSSPERIRNTIGELRQQISILREEDDSIPELMLIGEPVMISDSFDMIEQDGIRLRWSSSLLLVLTIFLIFRSVRWMLIPVVVVQFALLLTRTVLAWSDVRLTMVSSMMDAIITVIGVATTVHIIVRYRQARSLGYEPRKAMTYTFGLLMTPIFWAILTDAAGFMALWFSQLGPVRDFAIMMGLGSLMVLVSTVLLVPALSLIPLPRFLSFLDHDPVGQTKPSRLDANLQAPIKFARKNPVKMIAGLAVISIMLGWGVFYSEVESDFTRNFRANSEIVQSYEFVEENLGGAGVWDVILPAPSRMNYAYLKRIDHLERRLRTEVVLQHAGRNEPGLSKVISLADVISSSLPADLETLPLGQDQIVRGAVVGMRVAMPYYLATVYSSDPDMPERAFLRIMLRSKERRTTEEKKTIIAMVRQICQEEMMDTEFAGQNVVITGYYVLIANMIDSVIRDQWLTFAIAIGFIFVMLIIATRSLRYALICIVPNVVPILVVLGTLGWIGQKVNIGVAMIAAVSIGLSVDSSIHYIISFKRSLLEKNSLHEALDRVQNRVGRALVFSTVAIILGFSTLCISNFIPIVYFGILSIFAMIGGLVGNLIVLPLLLQALTTANELDDGVA